MSQQFDVWMPEYGEDNPEDGAQIEASTAMDAAEKRCENFDVDDPADDGANWKVFVRDSFGAVTKFSVSKSYSVDYSAYEDDSP